MTATAPRRACVFAHFDAQNEVKRYILHLLAALRPHCERIVFVSTAALPEAELRKALDVCDDAFTRANVGADFTMWKDGMARLELAAYDELLLTNSSVFGPLSPLERLFAEMAPRPLDVWSVTDARVQAWHLQSYFLVFRKPVLESEAFARFWASVLPYREKHQVILSYEIGLSRWLEQSGFALGAYVPCDALDGRRRAGNGVRVLAYKALGWRAFNPMSTYPDQVIRAGGPFVKAETLRENPMGIYLRPTTELVGASGYDTSLIEFDRPVTATPLRVLGGGWAGAPRVARWLGALVPGRRRT